MSSSISQNPMNTCRSCPCLSDCIRFCDCGKRCEIVTNMTKKNPLKRFARSQRFEMHGGCEHFEWIDDSLCDKVRSMAMALLVKLLKLRHCRS